MPKLPPKATAGGVSNAVKSYLPDHIAVALAQSDCDLGDEREVIRFLTNNGVSFGSIVTMTDDVIERARIVRAVEVGS